MFEEQDLLSMMRRLSSKQNECTTIEYFSSFDFRDAFSSFEITMCSFKLLKLLKLSNNLHA